MKNAFIIVAGILLAVVSKAQEYQYVSFPDSNAVWSEYYWSSESPAVYNKYALFNEDTVINGIAYRKLFHTSNSSSITPENSTCIGGIREDSLKRIYASISLEGFITPEVSEVLLYDFSLNEGDTLWRYISDILTANFTAEYLVVENIDTIPILNSKRKVFSFYNYPWTRWIEGIGNVQGLIFPSGDLTTGGDNSELICMHRNNALLYFNEDHHGCIPQFVIDGTAVFPPQTIKVFPNPVTGSRVFFENIGYEILEIYDTHGQTIRREYVGGLNSVELNIQGIAPGMYFYKLKTKGIVTAQGKLMVQ